MGRLPSLGIPSHVGLPDQVDPGIEPQVATATVALGGHRPSSFGACCARANHNHRSIYYRAIPPYEAGPFTAKAVYHLVCRYPCYCSTIGCRLSPCGEPWEGGRPLHLGRVKVYV